MIWTKPLKISATQIHVAFHNAYRVDYLHLLRDQRMDGNERDDGLWYAPLRNASMREWRGVINKRPVKFLLRIINMEGYSNSFYNCDFLFNKLTK